MTTKTDELLPCPFCGEKPYTASWSESHDGLGREISQVRCDCGSSGPERYGHEGRKPSIEAWNTRNCQTIEDYKQELITWLEDMSDYYSRKSLACGPRIDNEIACVSKSGAFDDVIDHIQSHPAQGGGD